MLEQEIAKDKGPHPIPSPGKKREVLIVDDNKAVQEVLSRMISFLGYHVTLAGNGLEGGTLFLTNPYDLVITDLQMPLMNGWELSRLVKERSPKTPVILVTGSYDEKHCEKMSMNCVDAVIPKPFRVQEVEKTIQRLLNSGP
jgi:CheY-like chemotaxis protein